jgi:hypothetical protein
MSQDEFADLRSQLDELLDQDYIQPSTSVALLYAKENH